MTPADAASHVGDDISQGTPRHADHRRTWPERFATVITIVAAIVCFAVAASLLTGYTIVRNRNIAEFENPAAGAEPNLVPRPTVPSGPATTSTANVTTTTPDGAQGSDGAPSDRPTTIAEAVSPTTSTTDPEAPAATFPDADPDAQNFLITGADNNACIDEDDPYYDVFGDREGMGERSDTIMIIRVDPSANRAAVLSLPRDLWVEIAGSGNMQRINAAYERNKPQRLADTVYENFGVGIDHFIQVDFCAFKELVDAVGGVPIPFEYPARDDNTGLEVPTTGCVTLDGLQSLAYVRSRHYEYEDPAGSGNWETDGTSDLGRISRQQDFLRRVLSAVLDKGPLDPDVARGLIKAATKYIVTNRELTPAKMLEFAGVLNDVDPTQITTYQIEATGETINGNSVLIPQVDGENMQAVLGLFRGDTSLADAPVQDFASDTSPPNDSSERLQVPSSDGATVFTTIIASTFAVAGAGPPDDTTGEPSESAAPPQENQFGIVPPRDVAC